MKRFCVLIATLLVSTAAYSATSFGVLTVPAGDNATEKAEEKLKKAMASVAKANSHEPNQDEREALETDIVMASLQVETQCSLKLYTLQLRQGVVSTRKARISAAGATLALLGGVATYAPVKTILMGLGISSATGSADSPLGVLANDANSQLTLTQARIDELRKGYAEEMTKYKSIVPAEDKQGSKRLAALIAVKAACDGLSAIAAQFQ